MPNWCFCYLNVYGVNEIRYDFKEFARGKYELDYNKFISYPEEYAIKDKIYWDKYRRGESVDGLQDGYNSGGYKWCIRNWGAKWNASSITVFERSRSILYEFISPWSPPIPAIIEMSKKYPELKFTLRYNEPNTVGVRGTFSIKDNVIKRY